MTVRFDPAAEREGAERALRVDLGTAREEYLPNGVGDAAVLMLESALTAWLVGLESDARAAVSRLNGWLRDSIDRGEVSGDVPLFQAMRRQHAYALTSWLLDGEPARAAFIETVRLRQATWNELSRLGLISDPSQHEYLGEIARDCVSAGEYETGVAFYDEHGGPPVADEGDVSDPATLAYWACLLHDPAGHATGSWQPAGERVLSGVIAGWISSGLGITAASWLKLVFWDSGATRTPSETLRCTYKLLPVAPPDWR